MKQLFQKKLKNFDYKEFLRFCVIGSINAVITYTVFCLLLFLGTHYIVASILGYLSGTVSGVIGNQKWTFGLKRSIHVKDVFGYLSLNLISLGASIVVLYLCVEKLFFPPLIGQIAGSIVSTISNYLGLKLIVFKKASPSIK